MTYSPTFSKKLEILFENAITKGVFPGAAVGVCLTRDGKKEIFLSSYGSASFFPHKKKMEKDVLFDLASLTKPFATTLSLLSLISVGKININEPLPSLLERDVSADKEKITLRHLLNHCSGFAAYIPFYKNIIHVEERLRKKNILDQILKEKLSYPSGSQSFYSDIGFIVLGEIVAIKSGYPLDIYFENEIMRPLHLDKKIIFNPLGKKKSKFAATENCPWRKKILCGEVHDDNTWSVGGVSGQAGLFGDIESVLDLCTFLLDVWKERAQHPCFSSALLKDFFKKQDIVKESSWALGFDTPSKTGSSAGSHISSRSVGHLGFTGTSFWIDPEKELTMVLLTNRVHPSRDNTRIKEFRPLFHNTIIENLF
ncbi:MAG: serine hydrolase [Desulfobulbaceae bacterium]|nr:serine hydrolase [Desulfobulbaceae bacterium]